MNYDGLIQTFCQLLIPVAIIFWRVNRREHFLWRLFGFGVLFLGITAAYYSPTAIPFLPDWLGYYLYYLVGYALVFLYVWLCFDLPFLTLVFFVLQALLAQNFSHHLFGLIMRAMGVAVGAENTRLEYLAILAACYVAVYTIFYFVFIRKLKLLEISSVPAFTLGVAGMFFLVMVGLGIYVRHINLSILENPAVAVGYELYSCILVLFLLCMLFGLFNIGKLQESNEQLERRIAQESRYYEIARANVDEINMRCHDLKHQLAGLKHMAEGEARQNAIAELENSLRIYESFVETGNEALDYILAEKGMYCESKNINFTVIADGKLLSFLAYNDIYVLFGNALDNAIESTVKIGQAERRIISLQVRERGGMAHIHLENVSDETPNFSPDGIPLTTKKARGHGYGMRSIRYIVEKYRGNLTITAEGGMFLLDILLPLPPREK